MEITGRACPVGKCHVMLSRAQLVSLPCRNAKNYSPKQARLLWSATGPHVIEGQATGIHCSLEGGGRTEPQAAGFVVGVSYGLCAVWTTEALKEQQHTSFPSPSCLPYPAIFWCFFPLVLFFFSPFFGYFPFIFSFPLIKLYILLRCFLLYTLRNLPFQTFQTQ